METLPHPQLCFITLFFAQHHWFPLFPLLVPCAVFLFAHFPSLQLQESYRDFGSQCQLIPKLRPYGWYRTRAQ